MKLTKISVASLFLSVSFGTVCAQVKKDSTNKVKNLEGVVLKVSNNKKTETAVLQEVRKSIVQKQAIGAEEISRKGISNVEQGLTKITGITTVEGKGLFVRGLEERYNTLLVNNLGTPSNNPFQKIVALKQFPTDVVGKLNIYKTFNSNLYADFAGATFDIETAVFEKPFTKVEFSVGINTQNTFRNNFKINENSYTISGYMGGNIYGRQLPSQVRNQVPQSYEFLNGESVSAFRDTWNVENVKTLPNTSLGFTTAQRLKFGLSNVDFLLSLNHGSKYEFREGEKNQFLNQGEIILNNDLHKKQYLYELESSALLNLGFRNRGTNINLNTIFLQNSSNLIEDYFGYKNAQVQNKLDGFFRTNQQDISRFLDLQLVATQKFGDRHQMRAGASYVINSYQQPDRKIMEGFLKGNNHLSISYGGNNLIRQYLDVKNKFYGSTFAEYSVFLGEKGEKVSFPLQLAIGYNGFADVRENSYRFIFSQRMDNKSVLVDIDKPQNQFDADALASKYYYREGSHNQKYKSYLYQFVNAGYLNITYKPNQVWDVLVGGRLENNMNISRYWDLIKNADTKTNNIRNQYFFLPSIAVKYAATSHSNIRFSASKTITRPILIEYMPIEYINPDNENIVGNENLKNSENYNVDLKFETYPTSKELFAINLFAKKIKNAIERSFVASGNSNGQTITFFNAKEAIVAGIELETILKLNRISDVLDNWTFATNATFMYSDVKRSTEQQHQESEIQRTYKRQLQGASPWVLNADLKYEFKNSKKLPHSASIIYNVSGSKIFGVGTNAIDNIYERPFHQLDFVYNTQISKNWNMKLAIQNILNSKYLLEVGDKSTIPVTARTLTHTDFRRGTNFNLTIGYTF